MILQFLCLLTLIIHDPRILVIRVNRKRNSFWPEFNFDQHRTLEVSLGSLTLICSGRVHLDVKFSGLDVHHIVILDSFPGSILWEARTFSGRKEKFGAIWLWLLFQQDNCTISVTKWWTPLNSKTICDKAAAKSREETLDTQSASNNYLATLEEQLISRHLTLVFQNSITGPVPRLQ